MNVKMVYEGRIESWDTRADGSATTSRAVVEVAGNQLVLWSELRFENTVSDGPSAAPRLEFGEPEIIATVGSEHESLQTFLEDMNAECGLLRLDVDGETIWEAGTSTPGADKA